MATPSLDRLAERLDRLERENRRLAGRPAGSARAGAAVVGVAAVVAAGAASTTGTGSQVGPLILVDKLGRTRRSSGSTQRRSRWTSWTRTRSRGSSLSAKTIGEPSLEFGDQFGRPRVALGLDPSGRRA